MCHIFHNTMKLKLKEKESADRRAIAALSNSDVKDTSDDSNDDIIDDSDEEPPGALLKVKTHGTEGEGRLEDYIGQFNALIEDSKKNVKQATEDQRVFSNQKINKEIVDANL